MSGQNKREMQQDNRSYELSMPAIALPVGGGRLQKSSHNNNHRQNPARDEYQMLGAN